MEEPPSSLEEDELDGFTQLRSKLAVSELKPRPLSLDWTMMKKKSSSRNAEHSSSSTTTTSVPNSTSSLKDSNVNDFVALSTLESKIISKFDKILCKKRVIISESLTSSSCSSKSTSSSSLNDEFSLNISKKNNFKKRKSILFDSSSSKVVSDGSCGELVF